MFYSLSSFTSPATVYKFNPATGESSKVFQPEIEGVNLDDYVTEQVFFTSKDGTKVPMFLTYKKGMERNGKNPVYLYGYGCGETYRTDTGQLDIRFLLAVKRVY